MRILTTKKIFYVSFLFCVTFISSQAQNAKFNIIADSKIENLLIEKRKINISIALNEYYKIQIYSGEAEKAKKTVFNFKQEFAAIDATIIFNTPNYKVWVGSFKTRMEAEKKLILIRKKFKNVLLIKPNKKIV
jgi:hypothetical protein